MARMGGLGGTKAGWFAALALCLCAVGHPASAQDGPARGAPPPGWREADAKHGRPRIELSACLRDQAWETRELNVPVASTAYGILAQCEVRVDHFEGAAFASTGTGSDEARQAADREALRQATVAIIQYRRCVGR